MKVAISISHCVIMESPRQHAKKAIRLVKRQQRTLKPDDPQIIEICTELALGLQKGMLPEWYVASTGTTNSTEAMRRKSHTPPTSRPPSQSRDEKTLPSSSNHTPSPLESERSPSEALRMTPQRSPSPRIPSSGLITTQTPSPILGLPPINSTVRLSLRGVGHSDIKKPASAAAEIIPERVVTQKSKRKKKRKLFSKEQENEMDKSEILSEYWNIPFDPFRENVLHDHKICSRPQKDYEDEEEGKISEEDIQADMDYWEIHKILHFVRIGDPTATVLALCALKEVDLNKASSREIVHQLNGIPLFLNILDTKNRRCRVAALKVLVLMASSKKTADLILRKNGIQQLVSILDEDDEVVVSLACDVLSFLVEYISVRLVAKKLNIIQKLMKVFMTCTKGSLKGENLRLCQSVCHVLWSCSQSIREQDVTGISEFLAVISRLVDSQKKALVVPLLGTVEECASVNSFRCKMEKANFLEKVLGKVQSDDRAIQVLCVRILFKCAADRKSRKRLLKPGSLRQLMKLLKVNVNDINDELLRLLLGIVWRCSVNQQHRKKFEDMNVFPLLIDILKSDRSLQVKSTALGVLSEFLWETIYAESVVSHSLVRLLVEFLSSPEPSILANSARGLGVCARNSSWREIILQLDGLRLLWSLLKNGNNEVLASSAVAIAAVCTCSEESAHAVRSIVGGVELLMSLLNNTEITELKVLICLCEAAVTIVNDTENRSILIDYGLVPALFRLCSTKSKVLRFYVACLISKCCEVKTERSLLSECIPFLVEGLGDEFDEHVHCAAICALNELSRDSANCVLLRESHTTKTLLNLLGSSNERIQDEAAGCLANIRKSLTVTVAV